jgi:hypothetical protein
LRDLVVKSAVPLNNTGVADNVSGAGRVDAVAAVQRTLPIFTGPKTLTVDANSASGATLTAAQLGFSDPNRCAVTTLAWSGGCGTGPGPTMTCPRGTNSFRYRPATTASVFPQPSICKSSFADSH